MSDVNTYYAAISDKDGVMFLIDVISSEEHKYESDVTEFPVESGADITDNIRPKPIEVTMECLVSDTPLETILRARQQVNATRRTLADATNFPVLRSIANADLTPPPYVPSRPSQDALAHLLAIRDARQPVKIITSLKNYDQMVLRELTVPRASGQAGALRFTASFVQVTIVTNRRFVRVSAPRAMGPKTNNKAPKPVAANNNYNDTLPLFKIMFTGNEYLWFDDDIQGWRYGVVHDPPSEASGTHSNAIASNTTLGARTGSAYSAAAEGWVFYKERPYGISNHDWANVNTRKYDYEYRNDIQNAYENAPRDPDGTPASVTSNPYDPRTPFGESANGNDISNGEIRVVHGRLVSSIRQPSLRHRHR